MKKFIFMFLFSFFILLLLFRCSKPKIVACFTVPTTIHVNTVIDVDCSCSTNARWYQLYIDGAFVVDGYSSKPQWEPVKTGSHTIKVIVYTEVPGPGSTGGAQDNTSQTVTVVP